MIRTRSPGSLPTRGVLAVVVVACTCAVEACGSFGASEPASPPSVEAGADADGAVIRPDAGTEDGATQLVPAACAGMNVIARESFAKVPGPGWTLFGSVAADAADFQSSPTSLKCALPGGSTMDRSLVQRTVALPIRTTRLCLATRAKVDFDNAAFGTTATDFSSLLNFAFVTQSDHYVGIGLAHDGMYVHIHDSQRDDSTNLTPFANTTWSTWSMLFDTQQGTVTLLVDDKVVLSQATTVQLDGAAVDLSLGLFRFGATGAISAHFDDLVLAAGTN